GAGGHRLPIVARLGPTAWAKFHLDLVAEGVQMTGAPDRVPALAAVAIAGLEQPGYRVYPIVDHIADKVCAILERRGADQRPSTRYKDLVDLVALIATARVPAEDQFRALQSEAGRRHILLPPRFDVPDKALWGSGYAAEAKRAVLPVAGSLPAALADAGPYLDPLFDGTATGVWHPEDRRWR